MRAAVGAVAQLTRRAATGGQMSKKRARLVQFALPFHPPMMPRVHPDDDGDDYDPRPPRRPRPDEDDDSDTAIIELRTVAQRPGRIAARAVQRDRVFRKLARLVD